MDRDRHLMRSVVEIVMPSESELLTTLDRVKRELNITSDASDEILEDRISEASSDITRATRRVCRARLCARRSGMTRARIIGARHIITGILSRPRCSCDGRQIGRAHV